MVKTVRVPDAYHEWLKAHTRENETMGEALRRLTRAPPPPEPVLDGEDADELREAIETLRADDRERLSGVAERLDDADIG